MKIKMYCMIFLYCFLMPPLIGQHQAIISSSGATSETEEYILDWTIGELAVSSYSFADQLFTEGFHQADPTPKPLIFTIKEAELSIRCFPNPFHGSFTVTWEKETNSSQSQWKDLECIVTNVYGEELSRKKLKDGPIQFDLSSAAIGVYFIHVDNKNTKLRQTQKLIKIK